MIILWITKDFSGTPGWEIIFEDKYISDGTVAIFCGVLPLILPNANPLQSEILFFLNKKIYFRRFFIQEDWKYEPIVQWSGLAKSMPWGALILLGAGLTVASAFQVCLLRKRT
jgi:di/tricarboxylate transporter